MWTTTSIRTYIFLYTSSSQTNSARLSTVTMTSFTSTPGTQSQNEYSTLAPTGQINASRMHKLTPVRPGLSLQSKGKNILVNVQPSIIPQEGSRQPEDSDMVRVKLLLLLYYAKWTV